MQYRKVLCLTSLSNVLVKEFFYRNNNSKFYKDFFQNIQTLNLCKKYADHLF